MIVIADISPINYLVLIKQVTILQRLYTRILIPPAVFDELTHPFAPHPVRNWTRSRPGWLEVVSPKMPIPFPRLDPGESEALALAVEMKVGVILIDDQAGRREAMRRGLKIAGTLSVLDDADQAGLLKFDETVARLRKTSFRVSQTVLAEIMQRRSGRFQL